MLIVVVLILWLIKAYKKEKKNPKLIDQYRKQGLEEQDIEIFRKTMGEAKDQIQTWEKFVKKDGDLQIIEKVTGGLSSAKKLFKLIVQTPNAVLKNDDFLYKKLPNMVELVEHYDDLKSLDKLDAELMTQTTQLIRSLSEKIAKTYENQLSDDIEKIKNEVENGE
ncbi:hypothetical protein Hs20B_04750 [Lactococcus insecticola]|uniref:5-bromo-4-chloroindolyl phosphate hydrolysis protein n=2 Tax=Pseudolactococcus insecticola TaxID=2709158 RepID=A0A6A0B8D1_9LACT|nr:hypothetical protein Hs20B_04750 [Lactococcus insecticola]